ncbi:chemotaxis protein [Hydrogenimonas cancrithermarum]|uniref:Chemotaxis protein n=1 Tax=Hydrogenimonas cancrithermarum TaxID=2993563 RepID=A0ABN6WW43_9BACT|nr:chemotaxis protein [Hydrogenimonas cancrithermarum]BDY13344.1 chemotaxis protein [Hydrogenimonas cancrithermarum]
MTQEELDALMAGDLDLESDEPVEGSEMTDETVDVAEASEESVEEEEVITPPPATKEHRVVSQLDDVTRDSEEKASEIFDALDIVMNDIEGALSALERMQAIANDFENLFGTLREKFPHIQRFKKASDEADELQKLADEAVAMLQSANDQILGAMDTMQYQDIHRQKIERVINIMRALSKYMSALFEGNVEDEKRVKSARHIEGDSHVEEVISNDDIEALIAQFGGK